MKFFEIKNRFNGKVVFSGEYKNFKICIEVAVGKKINLRGANLYGANLNGANLEDANLRDANLNGANLRDANLNGANLEDANLRDANLNGANLNGANLRGANLYGANLDFSSGTPLHCGGLKIKKDRRQIIQDLYHTASNMEHYLNENKDDDLQKVFDVAVELQDEFHRIKETGRL